MRRLGWPFAFGAVVLVFVPALVTAVMALFEYDGLRTPVWAPGAAAEHFVRDPLLGRVLVATAVFLAVSVPLRVGGAFLLALLLHRGGRPSGLARTAVYLPAILPPVAYGLAWLWILNPLFGPLNSALAALGAPTPAWLTEPNQARIGLGLVAAFQLGEGFIVMLAARREVPHEYYEVAALEGGGAWTRFRYVTLPALKPLLVLLAARDTVVALTAGFVPALVVTGGGPRDATIVLPLHVYRQAFESLRFGYAAFLAVLTFVVTAGLVWVQARVVRRTGVLLD